MRTFISTFAPLGRLYDSLRGLAARIHRVLGTRHKTVSTDHLGGVFLDNGGCLALSSKRSIVGTYDMHTPLFVNEDALRLALRERASRWITDWCAQKGDHTARTATAGAEHAPARAPITRQSSAHGHPPSGQRRIGKYPSYAVGRCFKDGLLWDIVIKAFRSRPGDQGWDDECPVDASNHAWRCKWPWASR